MAEKEVRNDTQEKFVEAVRGKVPVRVYLKNGVRLHGVIVDQDQYGIAFLHRTKQGVEETYIFKSAVVYIEPLRKIKIPKYFKK